MTGSQFERANIVAEELSATVASKTTDPIQEHNSRPPAVGLYDPSLEKDSCGVGFIANIKGKKSHEIVADALSILCNLEHRGAVGADPRAGDGAGILVQIPHAFFSRKAGELGFTLPAPGEYAIGALFMPRDTAWRNVIKSIIADQIKEEGLTLLGWRDVPTDNSSLGVTVKPTEPACMQVFIGRNGTAKTEDDFERRLYILRKSISQAIYQRRDRGLAGYYPCSMSCRTVIYKGMFLADQLGKYYPDLHEADFESALALVHQRFSTNTFPAWSLAHPYRMIAHNGEINTLRGNTNWMAARQASVSSELYGKDINRLWPISYEGQSDTACFDNALEFLVQGGYSLPHAVMMMIPEAWAGNPLMDEKRRAFYEYHAALMEPWDGPAAIAFTDGRQIGATLDRNGLRPARYLVTKDDRIVMASEMGVLTIPEDQIITKWRLQPGKMLLVDLEQGRLIPDDEIKAELARSHPYKEWLERTQIVLEELPKVPTTGVRSNLSLLDRQQAFGYSQEDISILMTPMASTGEEAAGSMGNDTPISALSDKAKPLFTYLQAELRAGHQPADRPDPRGAGDEPRLHHRTAAQPVRPARPRHHQAPRSAPADPDRCGSREDPLDLRRRRVALQVAHARHHLPRRSRCCRHGPGARRALRACGSRRPRGRQHHHPVRPHGRQRPGADPGTAGLRRRASSSDPRRTAHLGRPRRRIRRAARSASLRLPGPATAPKRSIPIWRSKPSSR
ncbi:glutamate synthase domain-containing protein 1 [Bradyrhizobium sp. i1.3.6]